MNTDHSKNISMKVACTGAISIVALVVFYGISLVVPATLNWYVDDFSGFLSITLISLAISAAWLFAYWRMDRLKPEPISMTLYAFVSAVVIHVGLALIVAAMLGRAASYGVRGLPGQLLLALRQAVVPAFSLYAVFSLYIFRLESFDEAVDGLIYGGFVGTGIAFSSGMMDFLGRESVSFQYVALTIVSKSTVYAAIGALTGFLLNHGVTVGKKKYQACAILLSVALFECELLIESLLDRSLLYAAMDVLRVAIAVALALCVFAATMVLIIRTLRASQGNDQAKDQPEKRIGGFGVKAVVVFFLLVFLCASALRWKAEETRRFPAEGGAWSFCLPEGFKAQKRLSASSVLANVGGDGESVSYVGMPGSAYSGMEISVDFHPEFREEYPAAEFSPQNGWAIGEKRALTLQRTADGGKRARYQYTFSLVSERGSALVEVFSPERDASLAHYVVRIIAKTMKGETHK